MKLISSTRECHTSRIPLSRRKDVLQEAIVLVGCQSDSYEIAKNSIDYIYDPSRMSDYLKKCLSDYCEQVFVVGPIDNRIILFVNRDFSGICVSLGVFLKDIDYRSCFFFSNGVQYLHPNIAKGRWNLDIIDGISSIRILLVSLYELTMFPSPLLALGISSIARSIRKLAVQNVKLIDMQFGIDVPSILSQIELFNPNIIGISATFGQQKILSSLLNGFDSLNQNSFSNEVLVVIGGSLASLNYKHLLSMDTNYIVATSSGEPVMEEVVRQYRGLLSDQHVPGFVAFGPKLKKINLDLSKIPGIAYYSKGGIVKTNIKSNRDQDDILPELDLLDETLGARGAMQLESSRGCSYACSFCPREHKGVWFGDDSTSLSGILPYVSEKYDIYKKNRRTIFLVDEEFIGYSPDSEQRVIEVSALMRQYKFGFETSSRVDQVYRPKKSREWGIGRVKLWRELKKNGLERCLFGVESGIDSVLKRFNKKTSSAQNVRALRILSLLGIPIRCTYITFDHLMNKSELLETYRFLGRRDLLLKKNLSLSDTDVYDKSNNVEFVFKNTSGRPFYEEVSYMLVSMENLLGSPYASVVEKRGLVTGFNPSMGRLDANFVDNDIGLVSEYSQKWIDRSFSLDYLLKGITKSSDHSERKKIKRLRVLLRQASFKLLGMMVVLVTTDTECYLGVLSESEKKFLNKLLKHWNQDSAITMSGTKESILESLLDEMFKSVVEAFYDEFLLVADKISSESKKRILKSFRFWESAKGWFLWNS